MDGITTLEKEKRAKATHYLTDNYHANEQPTVYNSEGSRRWCDWKYRQGVQSKSTRGGRRGRNGGRTWGKCEAGDGGHGPTGDDDGAVVEMMGTMILLLPPRFPAARHHPGAQEVLVIVKRFHLHEKRPWGAGINTGETERSEESGCAC
jgi:hypothetical protein